MKYKYSVAIVLAVMTIVGACGIVYEYALGFLGNNLIGSSHEALVMVMSFMMASMGLGAWLQSKVFKENLLDKFLIIEIILAMLGGVSILTIYTSYSYSASYQIHLYLYVSLMGAFIGAELPLIYRVNEECKEKYNVNICPNLSQLMGIDYFGALIGGALFAYALIPHMSIDSIVLNLAFVNLAVGVFALIYFWPLINNKKLISVMSVAVLAILIGFNIYTKPIMTILEQRCYSAPIVYSADSPYQHLVLTRSNKGVMRLFINGQLQFSSNDEHIYHEHLVHTPMTIADRRSDVLILGGGDGMALREVLKYSDVDSVTLVDLDPLMTQIFSREPELVKLNSGAFLNAKVHTIANNAISPGGSETVELSTKLERDLIDNDTYVLGSVKVLNIDADLFVRQIQGKYDVIIIDFPDPNKIELAKLYSVNFYLALQRLMHPHTIASVQSTSPYHAEKVFKCIGKSIATANLNTLPFHQNVPSFGEWGWHLIFPKEVQPGSLTQRISNATIQVPTKFLTEDTMRASFIFGKDRLLADVQPNTNMRPIIYEYYKAGWGER